MTDRLYEAESAPEPLSYENRTVLFCDILGWRDQIARAGADPESIGRLRRTILRPIQTLRQGVIWGHNYKFNTFSDNIVISCPANREDTSHLLFNMASFVSASVKTGFLIRGDVTIGNIIQDEHVVFGPALNRAYELESQLAIVPKIILDSTGFDDLLPEVESACIVEEDGWRFIDPFSVKYMSIIASLMEKVPEDLWRKAGFKTSVEPGSYDPLAMLEERLAVLKIKLRSPLGDKEYSKVSWLYNRIAKQLGVPPASSYPRVRPSDII
jgi:hypothetical protein